MEPVCLLCGQREDNLKRLGYHTNSFHQLSAKQYTINLFHQGKIPKCAACDVEPRYVAFAFRKYCKEHSHFAEAEAGKIGGKIKKTWSKNLTKNDHPILLAQAEKAKGAGNHFFGKKHKQETIKKLADLKRLSIEEVRSRVTQRTDLILLSSLDNYTLRQDTELEFACVTCHEKRIIRLINIERGSRCRRCFPVGSIPETEVANFVRSLSNEYTVVCNDRQTIKPYELDIYIPEKKIAIEYHGLRWHSEWVATREDLLRREKEKRKLTQEQGIKLIQLFADEWENKQAICKSMLVHRIGLTPEVYFARNCQIKAIGAPQAREFYELSHIDGFARSRLHLALIDNKTQEILSMLSLRQPNHRKYRMYLEISRFANRLNCRVVGGLSKLMKEVRQIAQRDKMQGILTYADLRFGEGNSYLQTGFTLKGYTNYGFFYTDGFVRYDRFKFRAQPNKSEKQVAEENGVRRTFTPGHAVYLLEF